MLNHFMIILIIGPLRVRLLLLYMEQVYRAVMGIQ